jgi:hypothetical protein
MEGRAMTEEYNELTERHGPVVSAFLTPNTSAWQGRAIQVTADGTWWDSGLDGRGWTKLEDFVQRKNTEGGRAMTDISKADRQRLADALRTATRQELLEISELHTMVSRPSPLRDETHDRVREVVAALALAVVDQMDANEAMPKPYDVHWQVKQYGDVVWHWIEHGHPVRSSPRTIPAALADFITREGK